MVLRANTDGWGWLNEQSGYQHQRLAPVLSFSFVAQTTISRLMWRTQDGTFDTDLDNVIVSDAPIGGAGMVQAHRSARLRTAAVAWGESRFRCRSRDTPNPAGYSARDQRSISSAANASPCARRPTA